MEVKRLGNIFGYTGGNFAGNVYDKLSLSLSLQHLILCKEVTDNR